MILTVSPAELAPGDVILSYKRPPEGLWPPSRILNRFFHKQLIRYSRKIYPAGDVMFDHVRLFVGHYDRPIGFEFTAPAARFIEIQPWMLDSAYSKVFRLKRGVILPYTIQGTCLEYDGTLYDFGQLIDTALGLDRFFDWSKKSRYCSAGARRVLERVTKIKPLFPEVKLEKTPPCSFANSPLFGRIQNHVQT